MQANMVAAAGVRDAEARFYFRLALAMAVTVVAAFGGHAARGLSSFDAPLIFHIHAMVFMAWVGLYLAQNWLVASGNIALHRRLGWIAAAWTLPMIWFALAITAHEVRAGGVPFFFLPQHFLIVNPLTLLAFVGLLAAAVALRRRTDWHRRLHLCAMAMIMGPALGRILPLPFMKPYAFEIGALAGLIFPLIAVWRDWRQGSVHAAWTWGFAALPLALLLGQLLAHSPIGDGLYQWVTAGTPGASVAPMGYPLPPPGF